MEETGSGDGANPLFSRNDGAAKISQIAGERLNKVYSFANVYTTTLHCGLFLLPVTGACMSLL